MKPRVLALSLFLATAVAAPVLAPPALAAPGDPALSAADKEKSRAAFRKGVAQARAQDWAAARASFEEAWSLVQHPSILLNLGIARLKTDDPVLAEQDLVRFLSDDAGAAPDEVRSAREALAEARAQIGTLHIVVVPPNAHISVDGKAPAMRALEGGAKEATVDMRVRAGAHDVTVEAEGFTTVKQSPDVLAKGTAEVRVTLVPEPKAPEPVVVAPVPPPAEHETSTRTIVGWTLTGVGGVALVTSGILALRALSLSHDYDDRSSASFQSKDTRSTGITFRTGADVALLTGVIAGATGLVLLLTNVGKDEPRAASSADPFTLRF